jgi:ParB family chromosome partitioning protein
MKLDHLSLDQLKISPLNVRKKGGKDIDDLVPSIRSLGLLQPLLVRPNCQGFEIVAGQRRFLALTRLAEEGIADPVPVAIMEDGDDARAIEASLAENIARLPMDEIDQYKAFVTLRGEGLSVGDIAARFGVTERLVEQRLAIAGIITPILNAYRREEISPETLRTLTMASPKQQTAWWKLVKSETDYAPTGRALKAWLFGGTQIPVSNALFDVTSYQGSIVSDLFGEERYFADSEAFWTLQNVAIAERRNAYVEAGWSDVVILDIGDHFQTWNHQKTPKKQGGKVFVCVNTNGEATFHEGWLTEKEARRKEKTEAGTTGNAAARDGEPSRLERPELTKAMRNYLGLHRHAAVRTELLARPEHALRLVAAHMIAGSDLWKVEAEPQRAENDAIAVSLDASMAMAGFAEERPRVRALLGIDADKEGPVVCNTHGFRSGRSLASIFQRLLDLDDADVVRVLTFVMAETLEAHSAMVETLGTMFAIDMRCWWTPDAAFFDLMRDKEAINAMLREVAGDVTADAHIASTAKVQKKIVADCLKGEGRPKVEGWLPRYMAFPAMGYTGRFVGLAPAEDQAQPDDAVEADGESEAEGSDGEASDDDLSDAA